MFLHEVDYSFIDVLRHVLRITAYKQDGAISFEKCRNLRSVGRQMILHVARVPRDVISREWDN